MRTRFRGSEIYYSTQGEGNPLLLLHGFLESSNIWDPLLGELSQRRQVICIDLPGHGRSESVSEVHSMELFAGVVKSVLDALDVKRADVMGHSMGGYVALAFLELYPERLRKLVLLNSSPVPDSPERKTNRDRSVSLVKRNKAAFVSMAIKNLLPRENFLKFKPALEKSIEEATAFPTQGIIAALLGMKIRTDRTEILKNFKGDKFIVTGAKDPLMPLEELKNIAKTTNSGLIQVSGGHLTYLENLQDLGEFVHFIE